MVFGKKKAEPKEMDAPPIEAVAQRAAQQKEPVQADVDLKGAIDEFNAAYGGMFPAGDSSNSQALLFAIYTELRELRRNQ